MCWRRSESKVVLGVFKTTAGVVEGAVAFAFSLIAFEVCGSLEDAELPSWLESKTLAAEDSSSFMLWGAAAWASVMLTFTKNAQSNFAVWFRPRNKCPAAVLCRSRPRPTSVGAAWSDVLAINAPDGSESGSLSEEVDAAPCGEQLASAPGLAAAAKVSVSPADKSTPVSVQG